MKTGSYPFRVFILLCVIGAWAGMFAQTSSWPSAPGHMTMELWPHGAPNAKPSSGAEGDTSTANDYEVAGNPSSASRMFLIRRLRYINRRTILLEPPLSFSPAVGI